MAIIKTYPLKSNYYGPDRLILSDMQPDDQGVVHGTTKSLTLSSLKSFIGSGSAPLILTTTGSSGPATLDINTNILNIPDYSVGNVNGSGTAGRIPKWQDSDTLDDSEIFQSVTNIGIGTTAPNAKLDILDTINQTAIRVTNNQYNNYLIQKRRTDDTQILGIKEFGSLGGLALVTGGSERLNINNLGNVGVGTAAPVYKLDVNGDLRAKGITSSTTHTVTIEASTGWYRLMQWGGASRGGAIVKLSTTGGNVTPTTYVINAYKTYGDPAATNTLKLEKYGNGGYITKARIATDSVTNVTYVEIYNAFTSANYTMEVYHDSLLGLDSLTSVLTGTLEQGPNSVSQDELPFVHEGTTTEKLSSELVTLIGDGTNDGKLRFNCSANSHYVEVVGPTHSGGSSYSLKLPNTLPSVSNQILEANALGVLSWIPTPSGGGGGGGTVTSVGLTMPPAFSVGNSPITGSGSISVGVTGGLAGEFLAHNGQWATPTNTTYSVMGSGNSYAAGLVLAGSSTHSGNFLRKDGTWGVPAYPNPSAPSATNLVALSINGSVYGIPQGTGNGTITSVQAGDGISGGGSSGIVTVTNSDKGSSQLFFKTIATPTNDVVASANNDTLTLAAGGNTGIFINGSGSQVTIGLSAPTVLDRGGVKLVNATTQSVAANGLTTTAGRTYAMQLNSSGQAVVNVPWTGGSGGGISFSGSTVGGLATFTNSSTAGVSSKVNLNASGLMDFDYDGNSAGSIDFDPTGTRLKIGDLSSGSSGIVEIFTNGNRQFQIGINGEIGLGEFGQQGTSGQVLTSGGNGTAPTWTAKTIVPSNVVTGAGNIYEVPMWNPQNGVSGSYIGAGNGFNSSPFKSNSSGQSIISTEINGGITLRQGSGAQVKIEGSTGSGGAYQINLPQAVAASTNRVLGVNSVSGSLMTTAWVDPGDLTSVTGTTSVNPTSFANTPFTFASTNSGSGVGSPLATQVASSFGNKHISFYLGTTFSGAINQSGANAVNYATSSDYRLKENVVEMTGAVDRLKQLKPSKFNFIADGPSRTVDGFLAHEVSNIVPEAITGSKDAIDEEGNIIPQSIDQSKLVPLLVGAIKELTARIEALEA